VQKKECEIRDKFHEQPSDEVLNRQQAIILDPGSIRIPETDDLLCPGKLNARDWLKLRLKKRIVVSMAVN